MYRILRLVTLFAIGMAGTDMAWAGCIPAPDAKLRALADRANVRPDLVLAAVDKAPDGPETPDIRIWRQAVRAEAHDLLSQPGDARRIAAAAMRQADPRSPVYVELLVRYSLNGYRKAEADQATPLIVAALRGRAPGTESVCLLAALGETARIRNQPDRAIVDLSTAYRMASRLNMGLPRVVTAEKLARVMAWGGDYDEALSLIGEVAAWYASHGQSYSLANALYFSAVFNIQRGSFDQALRELDRSRRVGAATTDRSGAAYIDLQECRARIELGQLAQAAPRCLAAERVFIDVDDDTAGQARFMLARIAFVQGDRRGALRDLDRVVASANEHSASVPMAPVLRLRSEVNQSLGRRDAALADLSAYVALTEKDGAVEREKQLLIQRARFATDRQAARNSELSRDLVFARERERIQGRYTREVLTAAAVGLILLGTIAFMALSHRRRLGILADHDGLTSLMNRRAISTLAPKLITNAYRHGEPLALVIVDLDHFKRVNDTFGHGVGDIVLAKFAAAATATLRRTDLIARWGGEEFVILLPGWSENEVRTVLDRLRQRLNDEEIVAGDPMRIRFSAGVSLPMPYDSFETSIARADVALYEAKRSGRDRTVTALRPVEGGRPSGVDHQSLPALADRSGGARSLVQAG